MENEEIEKKETNVVKVETMQGNPDNTESNEGFTPNESKYVVKGSPSNWIGRGLHIIQGKALALKKCLSKICDWIVCQILGRNREFQEKLEISRNIYNDIVEAIKKITNLKENVRNKEKERADNLTKCKKIKEKIENCKKEKDLSHSEIIDEIEAQINSLKEEKEKLSRELNNLGFFKKKWSSFKRFFNKEKTEEEKIQARISECDKDIARLEEDKKKTADCDREQLAEEIKEYEKELKEYEYKDSEYDNEIKEFEKNIEELENGNRSRLNSLSENNLLDSYLKITSVKTFLQSFILITVLLGFFLSSILFFQSAYRVFNWCIGQTYDINGGDIVAIISDGDYNDILREGHKFAVDNNLPILLSGTGNDVEKMRKQLYNYWKFPSDRIIMSASHSDKLKDKVEKSSEKMSSLNSKTPIVFTNSLKIPRMRCEFYKDGMKDARFYDILEPPKYRFDMESSKRLVNDAATRSPYSWGAILWELIRYWSSPSCWFPGGSGRK